MAEYDDDRLVDGLAELAGLLLAEESLEETLARVSQLAVSTLPGCDAADLTLLPDGIPRTMAATDHRATTLDDAQYAAGDGPCLDAARHQHVNLVGSTLSDERWPHFCTEATRLGILSALAMPLQARDVPVGALNLYSTTEFGLGDDTQASAQLFAAQAAVAVANARTHAALRATTAQLEEALWSRAIIDQAKGVIIAREHCSADAAFALLREQSQRENRKVRVVAQEIVDEARTGPPHG